MKLGSAAREIQELGQHILRICDRLDFSCARIQKHLHHAVVGRLGRIVLVKWQRHLVLMCRVLEIIEPCVFVCEPPHLKHLQAKQCMDQCDLSLAS